MASAGLQGGEDRSPRLECRLDSSSAPVPAPLTASSPASALRHPGFRSFVLLSAMAMMADNIEHVISYWVVFQKFDSPALGGFAVIAHWLPFLLLSIWSGTLADRYDPRRLIQLGMLIFIGVSLAWGVLFLTDTLAVWHACVLLVLHGLAGVLWMPSSQVLLHDIVGREQLQSAVRLNATGRQLGMLCGPAVGAGLLVALGPAWGIFCNALIYLPLVVWLIKAPYGPRFRAAGQAATQRAIRSFAELGQALRDIASYKVISGMTLLAGGAAFFIGNAYHAQMPGFAQSLGHGDAGLRYSLLLAADAAGALTAGILLESRGLLPPKARTACVLALIWCLALGSFALSEHYPLALGLLFVAGFVELAFNAMAQTLVQLEAPPALRGAAIGVYGTFAFGMRTFSGLSIGLVGAQIGIHGALAASAAVFFVLAGFLLRRFLIPDAPGR